MAGSGRRLSTCHSIASEWQDHGAHSRSAEGSRNGIYVSGEAGPKNNGRPERSEPADSRGLPVRRIQSVVCLLLFAAPAVAQVPSPEVTPFVPLPGPEAVRPVADEVRLPHGNAPFLDGRQVPPGGTLIVDPGCQSPEEFDNPFSVNRRSIQFLGGVYVSSRPGPAIPPFNYVPATFRYSWMLDDANEGKWAGNCEYLCELTVAKIFSDYGNYFVSPACVWRYNFVRPEAEFVPYAQLGLGLCFNDAYKDKEQHAIGALCQFVAHLDIGSRYFVSENWSVDLEGGITHISNSSTAGRNLGVNAFGIALGVTYYFPTAAH